MATKISSASASSHYPTSAESIACNADTTRQSRLCCALARSSKSSSAPGALRWQGRSTISGCFTNSRPASKKPFRFTAARSRLSSASWGRTIPSLASIYHNLGGLEHARGRYARGEPFARRSVELRERAFGPDHPDVAADVAAFAALLDGQGKYDEAEPLYRRALSTFERVYGSEHYEIAVNLNNLAAVRQAMGDPQEAEAMYTCALRIKEKLFGKTNTEVAMTANNLAVLYKAEGKVGKAKTLYRRALKIFEKELGPKHPHTITCRENYESLTAENI